MRKENGQIIELKPQLTRVQVGNWEFLKGPEIRIPQSITLDTDSYIKRVSNELRLRNGQLINGDANFFSLIYGVPSPLIRLDIVPFSGLDFFSGLYDLETRPDGLSIQMGIDPSTIQPIKGIFNTIENRHKKTVCVMTLPNTDRTKDDAEAFARAFKFPLTPFSFTRCVIWPRGYNFTPEALEFQKYSLTKLQRTRQETLRIGAGKKLIPNKDGQYQIDWDHPFCLKPYVKQLPYGIAFWHPDYPEGDNQIGYSSQRDIKKILKQAFDKKKGYIVQDLIYPKTLQIGSKQYHAVFHIFAGYNFKEGRYELIGGSYTANSSETGIRVHGGKDAVIGPLTFSQNTASQQT